MKKFSKFPEIEQFRTIIHNIKHQAQYQGQDDDGNVIMDRNATLPILTAFGTEKLHGTNASVGFNNVDGIWSQSRKNIITVDKDNAGFAFFVEKNKEAFLKLIHQVIEENDIDADNNNVYIYGEWAGKGIQKHMGINKLDKFIAIFGVKIAPFDEEVSNYWVDCDNLRDVDNRIYNINDFETYSVEIDFNNPGEAQNKMIDMMLKVEENSPFSKSFGEDGIGEGIVFTTYFNGSKHTWKVKGERHSNTKVKTPKKVDNVKIQKINDIAVKVLPSWRLDQMYTEVMDILNGGSGDIKKTGDFLKAVVQDVHKEDLDIIIEAELEPKEVNGAISKIARVWLFDKLNEEAGL
jgi:RNA ligase-like protein